LIGGGLARIEVNPKSNPFNWMHYVKMSKTPGYFRRAMERAAFDSGADPSEWYASFKPIRRGDWYKIDIFDWDEQCWKPYSNEVDSGTEQNIDKESHPGSTFVKSYDAITTGQFNGNYFESYGFERDRIILCHGTIKDSDGEEPRHGHSWLEYGDAIIDFSNSKRIQILPKDVYYALNNVMDALYYDINDVRLMSLMYGNKGPWE